MPEEKTETSEKMSKKQFWIRFSLWALFAAIIPVGFIIYKYGLFVPANTTTKAQYQLSGWGIISIVIVAIFLLVLLKDAMKGLPNGSMIKQCVKGIGMLIPLFLFILMINSIKDSIEAFEEVLIVLLVSELVAVPINPFPKWATQNNIDMTENIIVKSIKKALGK